MAQNMVDVDAVILSGGRGLRMGGLDKGLVDLGGMPLVAWSIAQLRAQQHQPTHILISANRNLADYGQFGLPVLRDIHDGFLGPLAGIHAAMLASPAEFLLVVPVDAPFLPPDLLTRLRAQIGDAAIAVTQNDSGRVFPTTCLIRRGAILTLIERMNCMTLTVDNWVDMLRPVYVSFAGYEFDNINTPDDLARCQRRVHRDSSVSEPPEQTTSTTLFATGTLRLNQQAMAELHPESQTSRERLQRARDLAIRSTQDLAAHLQASSEQPLAINLDFAAETATIRCIARCDGLSPHHAPPVALHAAHTALLSLYGELHALDQRMVIGDVRLLD
ncbi:molybdenum cofactor guanylyltransferase [Chitinibacteraceae bacterium HSL-7]